MRTLRLLTLPAVATLVLPACTSEDPAGETPTTDDAVVTSDDGLEGSAPTDGWFCRYVAPDAVDAAVGGTAETPRELVVQDDEEGWACEVLTGGKGEQEPVLRVSILIGEEARAEARSRAEAADGVRPGPEFLGLSFVSPGLVTGLTSCMAPGATNRADQAPYTLIAEQLSGEVDEATTANLRATLSGAAQSLDKAFGCAPRQALKDQAAATTAP